METFVKDLRLAVRTLTKNPGFTAIAVLTLALGIAVNATMFSLVSAFLLRRPPGREVNRVAVVSSVNPKGGSFADVSHVSAPNYLAWREANHVFADLAAADELRTVILTSPNQPEALRSAAVSPNYFGVLGVTAQLGRTFADGEDQPGRDHVIILSHELWERLFQSDPGIVGRSIRLNRESWDIVGVMPANFKMLGFLPEVWTPLVLDPADQTAVARQKRSLLLFGRLNPEVTVEQARAELVTLARRAQENFPESEREWGASVRTLSDFLVYSFGVRTGLALLMITDGLVLMIACANVAGLLLARAAGRRRELAIRISLGASRWRIVRQLLTEGLVIASFGGAVGLLFAYGGIRYLDASLAANVAVPAVPLLLDWNVFLFALGVSVFSAVLCGLVPALSASRTDVNTGLKDEGQVASGTQLQSRLRTVMVTGEIALAFFLLVGTGLLLRALDAISSQDLGFQKEQLLTARVTLDDAQYKDAAKQVGFVDEVVRRAERIPGASGAAVTSLLPATGARSVAAHIRGQGELTANQRLNAVDFVVTPEYFSVARIPLLRGRAFTQMDNDTAPRVMLVNQEFVHRNLQDQEPLGKQIRLDLGAAANEWGEIVGVVGNVKTNSEETRDDPQVYEAYSQRPIRSMSLLVQARIDPNGLTADLREVVAQVDADLPLSDLMSMPTVIARQGAGDKFFSHALGSFGVLALILAAIGIYGLVAYSVGQRTQEIGIRMAVGAKNFDIVRMVLGQGLRMAAIGGTIGFIMALPLPKLVTALFYGLVLPKLAVYFIVPLTVLLVAILAAYVPARRAAQIDPMRALRAA
jgi:putative ABC transport system permease protein